MRSREDAKAIRPYLDTRPYVGIMAGMPQKAPGCRIDPPVSVPSETTARPAATAAAEPPLEPPGTRSSATGFRTGPYAEFSFELPMANSSQLVLPRMTAPASSRRSTAVASYGGRIGLEDLRSASRAYALRADHVFNRRRGRRRAAARVRLVRWRHLRGRPGHRRARERAPGRRSIPGCVVRFARKSPWLARARRFSSR